MEKLILGTIYKAFHNTTENFKKIDIIALIQKENKELLVADIDKEIENIMETRSLTFPAKKNSRKLTLEEIYFSLINETVYFEKIEGQKLDISERRGHKCLENKELMKDINSKLQDCFKNMEKPEVSNTKCVDSEYAVIIKAYFENKAS